MASRLQRLSFVDAFSIGLVVLYAAVALSALSANFFIFHVFVASFLALCLGSALFLPFKDPSKALMSGFTLLYCLFHFGIVVSFLIDPSPGNQFEWYRDGPLLRTAYFAALTFLFGMTLSVPLTDGLTSSPPKVHKAPSATAAELASFLLLSAAVGAWFIIVKGAMSAGNYMEYIERVTPYSRELAIIYPVIAASVIYGCLWSKRIVFLIIVFSVWAVPALLVGLRYTVLITIMLLLLTLHARGKIRVRWQVGVAAVLCTLIAISFIQVYRLNAASAADAASKISLTAALSEMGHSIYPVRAVLVWIENGVDHFRWGETYWAPLERTLAVILPIERPNALEDDRLMDIVMIGRDGTFGFSISAEALINFGLVGCFFIGILVGAILCYGGKRIEAGYNSLVSVAVAFGIFYHVRQGFVGSYGSAVYVFLTGLTLLGLIWFAVRVLVARRNLGARLAGR